MAHIQYLWRQEQHKPYITFVCILQEFVNVFLIVLHI